jgi:hypothetical protein
MVSAADPLRSLISVSWTGVANFSFKCRLIYAHEAEWTPFQTHGYSENLIALEIETSTFGSAARNSDH